MAYNALDIAKAFVAFSEPEKGDLISNLKVQKLLYYAQGFHLAEFKEPFFNEDLIAWQYGPVVTDVYHNFKEYGSNPIPIFPDFTFDIFNAPQLELLKEVNQVFGQFSAIKLMNMTHNEPPYNNTPLNAIIPHSELMSYFTTQLEK